MKASTFLAVTTALLVVFLGGASFALSYDSLRQLAGANGYPDWRAWIWPLTLDSIVVVSALSVIRCNVVKEKAVLPWAMTAIFSVASIVFNILHAPPSALARTISALPPTVVLLSLELLSGQLKSAVMEADKAYRKAQKEDGLTKLSPTVDTLAMANVKRSQSAEQAIAALLTFYASNPKATQGAAGEAVSRSRQWVSTTLKSLETEGQIERGNGLGVVVK